MSPSCIVICHSSKIILQEISEKVTSAKLNPKLFRAKSLTEAYHFTEHQSPELLLISSELAALPEFELLYSLASILKIACLVISDPSDLPATGVVRRIPCISIDAPPLAFEKALSVATHLNGAPEAISKQRISSRSFAKDGVILIGASTGGVDALAHVLSHFSADTPPTLIVQHTGGQFSRSLIKHLDGITNANVCTAVEGQTLDRGQVYLAPNDQVHLCINTENSRTISLRTEGLLSGHRPSIDALFRSAVPIGHHVAAAILTGMGKDGARGLKLLHDCGAHTIGQDSESSVVYGMPRVAQEMGAVREQLPLQKIGPALLSACMSRVAV
jgi:two-component system chemotaxis response regulator CheB